jgi:PAS domain S-box-containing protein
MFLHFRYRQENLEERIYKQPLSDQPSSQAETQTQQSVDAPRFKLGPLGKLSLEISIIQNKEDTLQGMLTACTEAMVRHLDIALARIWLFNEAENVLEVQASSGMYTHLDGPHARVPIGTWRLGLIASERASYMTNDVASDPDIADQEWARQEEIVGFAGYPLLVGKRLIGVLALFTRYKLDNVVLQTIETIANGLALAVERLSLLERERVARAEAENSRLRLYSLFMQAPAIICLLNGPEHIFEFANPLYLQIIGNRPVVGKKIREALPELAGQGFFELLDSVYTTGEPFFGKEQLVQLDRRGDGTLEGAYLDFVYQPNRNAQGEIDGILVHAVDVTHQVEARVALQQSQKRLSLAHQAAHIGTFEWDIRTNEIIWTPELEALYGLPSGGFEGKYENWAQRVHPDDLQQAEVNLQTAAAGGPPYNTEFRVIWPDGTQHWLLAKGEVTHYDDAGRPRRMIGVNIDITDRKKAEQDLALMNLRLQDLNANLEALVNARTESLRQTNTELQRSNQELQDFAYVASHDLQEPLRKIQAFGNLLEEEYGKQLGEGKSYLDRMRNSAGRMRVLIEDLLTFSRVTTKAQPFAPVDFNVIMRDVIDDLSSRLQTTQGNIEVVGDLPTIEADPRQMYQMLQNLLNNALKFHQPGQPPHVRVHTELREPPDAPKQYMLFIEDNGIGFDEKYLDRIFTVFQRLHGRGSYEGTGIGLAVVRKIVERHGGTITASSTPGKGSTFIVTLPACQVSPEER